MAKKKEGMVLVMVLVFIVISQTIYLGLLHLNRINGLRYADLTQLYQSQVEEAILLQSLEPILQEQNSQEFFQEMILNKADTLQAGLTFKKYSILTADPTVNQADPGWYEIDLPLGQTGLLIYRYQVYLSPGFDALIDQVPPSFSGYLDPNNLPRLNEGSSDQEWQDKQNELLLASYELTDHFYLSRQYNFSPHPPPNLTFIFNTGQVQIVAQDTGYELYFYNKEGLLVRKLIKETSDYPYVIRLQAEIYQKPKESAAEPPLTS